MASIKDMNRVFNGISLVAKEFLRRSEVLESGNFETLISKSLKKAVVAATDLSGLTKGKVKPFASNNNNNNTIVVSSASSSSSSNGDSVVYFDHDHVENTDCGTSAAIVLDEINVKIPDYSNQHHDQVQVHLPVADLESKSGVDTKVIESQLPSRVDIVDRGLAAESSFDRIVPQLVNAERSVEKRHAEKVSTPVAVPIKKRTPRERRVPSTPAGRVMGFAGLGIGLAWGAFSESTKRLVYGTPTTQGKESAVSPFLSEQNAERLALGLCRMRGAALKLGQMLSIQDESLVPAPILAALEIVRQGADVMPRSQLNQVLAAELGSNWTSKLTSFDYEPLASASIGQVHRAVMKDGTHVAMKIQYPGVADSIESDIDNVKMLLNYTNLLPKGLYLDSAMKVAKEELSRECDYVLEASNQKRFRELLSSKKGIYVPMVFKEISSKRVLTTELIEGIPIDKVALLDQETRNYIGKTLLELTLMELFVFRFMQTDPNWGNFLYDEATRTINLIDFGAARDYPKSFVDDYLRMVLACSNGERDTVIEMSKRLGFLTGMESEVMLDAHVQAGFVVGLPFSKNGGYDFRATNIAQSISNLGATMLRHRLTPPPDEAYSLHRKLSGAFLACIKLGAVVPCRELLLEVYKPYQFGQENGEVAKASGLLS